MAIGCWLLVHELHMNHFFIKFPVKTTNVLPFLFCLITSTLTNLLPLLFTTNL